MSNTRKECMYYDAFTDPLCVFFGSEVDLVIREHCNLFFNERGIHQPPKKKILRDLRQAESVFNMSTIGMFLCITLLLHLLKYTKFVFTQYLAVTFNI